MNPTDRVKIPSHVMARTVEDETAILNLASGTYFGLDPVGARIWGFLSEGKTLAEVCDAMMEHYDVDRETIERDLDALLIKLAEHGLVESVEEDR